jgi:dTDP-4-dehydrorhamnose reductase
MILVSGNGILANELLKLSTDDLPITILSKKEMDITDEYIVSDVIKSFMMKPDFPKYFVHTAALTKPMRVNDKNPIMSMSTNIVGTANVARICYKYGIKFIYISTDFVYDSEKVYRGKWTPGVYEESKVKPSNNYGWSKLGGECVSKLIPNSLILRCSLCDIPFRHKIAFNDVYRNSITHEEVAGIILKIKDEVGIINVGGEHQSVYEFVSQYQKIDTTSGAKIAPSLQLNIEKLKGILNE